MTNGAHHLLRAFDGSLIPLPYVGEDNVLGGACVLAFFVRFVIDFVAVKRRIHIDQVRRRPRPVFGLLPFLHEFQAVSVVDVSCLHKLSLVLARCEWENYFPSGSLSAKRSGRPASRIFRIVVSIS